MANDLKGRVAFITGGTSAMGLGIAKACLEVGAKVVLGDLDQKKLDQAKEDLSGLGEVAVTYLNLTDPDSIDKALDAGEAAFGDLDILINNAGVCVGHGIMELTKEAFERTFAVNVTGLFQMSQKFAARVIEKKIHGNIVNIASNAAKVCFGGMADYNASKAAVMNLTQSMALEWADKDINVNAVCPGAVDTDMLRNCMLDTERATNGAVTVEEMRKTWGPPQLGRLVQPYEVGCIVRFLASTDAILIRGQAISIDAGNTRF